MITEIRGFEFDKHVLKIDKEIIKNKIKFQIGKRFFNKILFKETLADMIDKKYFELNNEYAIIRSFFNEMDKQKYCGIKHIIEKPDYNIKHIKHTVSISGAGVETFNLNGLSQFYKIRDSNITTVPVEKNKDTFYLILFNHPQIEIPTIGKINVLYEFDTSFSLGQNHNEFSDTSQLLSFTRNPLLTKYTDLNASLNGIITHRFIYGKPGEIVYRCDDGFYQEIKEAIFGSKMTRFSSSISMRDKIYQEMCDSLFKKLSKGDSMDNKKLEDMLYINKRNKFEMQGTITFDQSNNFIYQGMIESSGTFPFFIDNGNNNINEEK